MAVAHKGSISMGLVLNPIGMYKTSRDNDIHFNRLDKESKVRRMVGLQYHVILRNREWRFTSRQRQGS